jgi:hypothetical protein
LPLVFQTIATSYLVSLHLLSLPPFIFFLSGLGKRVRRAPKASKSTRNGVILVEEKEDPSGKGERKERLFFSHAHSYVITVIVAIRRRSLTGLRCSRSSRRVEHQFLGLEEYLTYLCDDYPDYQISLSTLANGSAIYSFRLSSVILCGRNLISIRSFYRFASLSE